jgi:RNA polymerase sigma factor (sigma-70 family)
VEGRPVQGALPRIAAMITEALIDRCIRRDPKAQHELYTVMYPKLMAICCRYERNRQDAAATLNQGFLKILQHIGARRPEVPFEPWARRIVINTVIDAFRRNKERKAQETLDASIDHNDHQDVNSYLGDMEAEAFAELLLRLPPMSRNVFNLFAIDGFAHAEIAQLLGISEGTSKWHVSHARSILQQAIAELSASRTINASIR